MISVSWARIVPRKGFNCVILEKPLKQYAGLKTVPKYADWFDAFDALEEHLGNLPANRKKVVFFDEMPWIDTQKSDFVEALENFWNGWANRRNDIFFLSRK